jgi:hypothetical protein
VNIATSSSLTALFFELYKLLLISNDLLDYPSFIDGPSQFDLIIDGSYVFPFFAFLS